MPTDIIKYVDPDMSVLADYPSLQAAITAEKAIRPDLVARDEVLKLMCISSAGSPDTYAYIAPGDFVTDSTRNIVIEGDNNTGIWDSSKYRIEYLCVGISLPQSTALAIGVNYTTVKNMQVRVGCASSVSQLLGIRSYTSAVIYNIINCIGRGDLPGGSIGASSAFIFSLQNNSKIINSVAYNLTRSNNADAALFQLQNGAIGYNLLGYNSNKYGVFNYGAAYTLKNAIIQNTVLNCFGGNIGNISNSIADDNSIPASGNYQSITLNFADAANGDFRLLAGSPGIDQGVDLSADPNFPFNTDIIGTTRPQGAAWDIGAFELIQQSFNPAWAKHSNQIIRAL